MPDSLNGYTVSEFQPYDTSSASVVELAYAVDKHGETVGFIWRYDGHDLRLDPAIGDDLSVPDVPTALSLLAQLDCVIAAAGNLLLAITALQALQSTTE